MELDSYQLINFMEKSHFVGWCLTLMYFTKFTNELLETGFWTLFSISKSGLKPV